MTEYRTGRKVGRTIYANDVLVGMMDSSALAMLVVDALNESAQQLACANHGGSSEWGRNCPECAVDKDETIHRLKEQLQSETSRADGNFASCERIKAQSSDAHNQVTRLREALQAIRDVPFDPTGDQYMRAAAIAAEALSDHIAEPRTMVRLRTFRDDIQKCVEMFDDAELRQAVTFQLEQLKSEDSATPS